MDRLVAVVEALRDHCPWTAALTHADLAEYLVEEAYEAVAEIESRDAAAWADVPARRADGAYPALAAELGDVLFQVVLHAAVSREPGAPAETAGFRLDDAADALTAKMIRHYESIGLLPASTRTDAGYRQYSARDLDTLHFRQTEEVLFMIMESERKLRSNIRGAARRVGFLEPKQDLVPNEELHRLIAIDHVDSIVAHQSGLSPVDYLFPDEVGATAFASPDANEAACQPIVPCVKDG